MSKDAVARLAELRRRFPAFHIAWQFTHGHRTRYIAQRIRDGVHPYTLVTADLAELHEELSQASRPPAASRD
ncbi:MAG TPA: hypothetical protein VGH27_30155 [Streptosporangiaceae bacterium]|jgi:hypothetical protein